MATAIHHLDLPRFENGARIQARVGVAHWVIDLDHRTLAALGEPLGEPGAKTIQRIMESVRAKAVGMRWYGGGHMSLDPAELGLPAPRPVCLDDGSEPSVPWYSVIKIAPLPRGAQELRVVG